MIQTFWRTSARIVLASLVALLCSIPAAAQQTLGSINGTVVDPSGAAVVGATVKATNAAINVTSTATTSGTGYFQIFNLPIGTYVVTVSRDGFETSKLENTPVQEARATTVNVSLKVGQATESVEVTATPLLNATDTTNGYTLDAAQIEITPLATGSFTQLAVLSPGVNAELLSNLDSNCGPRQSAHLGQRPARHLQHLPGQRRRLHQPLQRQELQRLHLAALQLQHRQRTSDRGRRVTRVGTSVYGSNGNSLPSPPPEFTAGTSRQRLDVRRAAGRDQRRADRRQHQHRHQQLARPALRHLRQQLHERLSVLLQPGTTSSRSRASAPFPQSLVNPSLHPLDHRRDRRRTHPQGQALLLRRLSAPVQLGPGHRPFADARFPRGLTDDRSAAGLARCRCQLGRLGHRQHDRSHCARRCSRPSCPTAST